METERATQLLPWPLQYSVPGRDTDFWPQNEPPSEQQKGLIAMFRPIANTLCYRHHWSIDNVVVAQVEIVIFGTRGLSYSSPDTVKTLRFKPHTPM